MASRPLLSITPPERQTAVTGGDNLELRKHCDEVSKSIMPLRSSVDPTIAEIASLTQSTRSRFCPTPGGRARRSLVNKLYDGHGSYAARILRNGMATGLSQPARPWFKLKVPDDRLMEDYATKVWLEAVERALYSFFAATNFYSATEAGYGELGLFGTEAAFMDEHWDAGMVAYPLTFGEYWTALDDAGRPDTLLRYVPMTVRQMVKRFVSDSFDSSVLHWDRVSNSVKVAWDNSNYANVIDVMHLVEPNPAWDPARFDAKGKKFRSVYWEGASDNRRILEASGNEEKPFWVARWDSTSGFDPYGSGPGWDALTDLRGLQAQSKRKGQATDYCVRPPMVGPANFKMNLQPGAYNATSVADKGQVFPAFTVDHQTIGIVGEDVKEVRAAIDRHFFVDLFFAITQMDGVQPRNQEEIFSRNEEKMTQLGPVIDRVNVEKLGVAIDRAFGICNRRGLFPPPPPALERQELQVDYISVLAQAQRAAGLASVERSLGFIGNLAASFPDALDNIDSDEVVTDYLQRQGFPEKAIRDPMIRDGMRQQRQQEKAAEQARASAPAAVDGAKAAQLLAQTDLHGQPMLDQISGAYGG